jgi:[ribosomal protein S5]-alanine N-acetyltransferase
VSTNKEGKTMMLKGEKIGLRTVREADLERLYEVHEDIGNRGAYYPWGVMSEATFRQKFQETGFWKQDSGTLLMVTAEGAIVGEIQFFPTVSYLDELELAYLIYADEQRGAGYTTEALRLMAGYLFDTKRHNRLRLIIHPENRASQRVAEKCGFRLEGTARGAWFHRGRHHDVLVYALLREEYRAVNGDGQPSASQGR